jgi:ATP-dependent Clp protease adaptor protein ClpS
LTGMLNFKCGRRIALNRNAEFRRNIMANTNDWLNFEHLAEDKVREGLKPPSMYKVILNNDDYTPMEFVIDVLQKFFSYDVERATQLMLKVHYQGKAICGVFTAEVAETKVAQVNNYARENEHPLLCTLEKA